MFHQIQDFGLLRTAPSESIDAKEYRDHIIKIYMRSINIIEDEITKELLGRWISEIDPCVAIDRHGNIIGLCAECEFGDVVPIPVKVPPGTPKIYPLKFTTEDMLRPHR